MSTTVYLRRGKQRPFHILSKDGETAVCGAMRVGDSGVGTLAVAPSPLSVAQVCPLCVSYSQGLGDEGEGGIPELENSGCSDFSYTWSAA